MYLIRLPSLKKPSSSWVRPPIKTQKETRETIAQFLLSGSWGSHGSVSNWATTVVKTIVREAWGPEIWPGVPPRRAATNPPMTAAFTPIRADWATKEGPQRGEHRDPVADGHGDRDDRRRGGAEELIFEICESRR